LSFIYEIDEDGNHMSANIVCKSLSLLSNPNVQCKQFMQNPNPRLWAENVHLMLKF